MPRVYPKSANFALPVRESEADPDEAPQSARAAVRSWSTSGGMREATFKKRPASSSSFGKANGGAVGFAVILNAADEAPRSRGSLDGDEEDEEEGASVRARAAVLSFFPRHPFFS